MNTRRMEQLFLLQITKGNDGLRNGELRNNELRNNELRNNELSNDAIRNSVRESKHEIIKSA